MNNKEAKMLKMLQTKRIQFRVLPDQQRGKVFSKFAESFIESEKRESVALNFHRPPPKQKTMDYHKYFTGGGTEWGDCSTYKEGGGVLSWLLHDTDSWCYLLWSEPWIPILTLDVSSLAERTLYFFPDSYWVSSDIKRVLVITRDNDVLVSKVQE